MAVPSVRIYTDGACRGNPGVGGWGAVLLYADRESKLCGAESDTTNNRMELTAAIVGLEAMKRTCQIELSTDSKYLINGMEQWLDMWRLRNWRTSDKKAVKNIDLWQRLDKLASQHQITWRWVKGHSGDHYNEMADALANQAIDQHLLGTS